MNEYLKIKRSKYFFSETSSWKEKVSLRRIKNNSGQRMHVQDLFLDNS